MKQRIAIVGSGIAGLGTAWLLQKQGHDVTVFESDDRPGGHTHTVDVSLEGITHPVDTGFLVFNDRTYPHLLQLFSELGVGSVASEMSFSVRNDAASVEWSGTRVSTLFANPRNAFRAGFWSMLAGIMRFNREATDLLARDALPDVSLRTFLDRGDYSASFRDWYLVPMAAAIWSSPRREILAFPLPSFVRFCNNHGLMQISDRPQWRTVQGGGREYVRRIVDRLSDLRLGCEVRRVRRDRTGVEIDFGTGGAERFDEVVLACHSDQALSLLVDPSAQETRVLSQVRYQDNRVVLHTDVALLPRSRRAWSAWNYLAVDDPEGDAPVAVSYLINRLQPLPFETPVIVTLNPPFAPDPNRVLREFTYSHPLLDRAAVVAQSEVQGLQGLRHTWFAGAWLGNGFHEDGLRSAHAVAQELSAGPRADTMPRPQLAAA